MGGWEIFTRNGGKPGKGRLYFIFHIFSNFMKTPYIAYPPLFQILSTHCQLQLLPPLFFLLSSFFGWMDLTTFDVLFYLMLNDNIDLHMLSLGTLVPEGPWCVFHATRLNFTEVWHNVVFYWYSDLLSRTHTAHSGASRLTHWYKYIFIPYVVCSLKPEKHFD